MAEDLEGGLMYQQLRKFINVIVSLFCSRSGSRGCLTTASWLFAVLIVF